MEDGEKRWGDEQLDTACDARGTANEPGLGEGQDHLVDGGRRDAEVALEVRFRGRAAHDHRVGVNEGQVLALLLGEVRGGWHGGRPVWDRHVQDFLIHCS